MRTKKLQRFFWLSMAYRQRSAEMAEQGATSRHQRESIEKKKEGVVWHTPAYKKTYPPSVPRRHCVISGPGAVYLATRVLREKKFTVTALKGVAVGAGAVSPLLAIRFVSFLRAVCFFVCFFRNCGKNLKAKHTIKIFLKTAI